MDVGAWLKNLRYGRRRGVLDDDGLLPTDRIPFHVAIIMDGNGRWAARRHLPALAGHRAGTRALKRTVEAAIELGVRQLTVFSFSTENWSRPPDEVQGIMDLVAEMIDTEVDELDEHGVRLRFVGRLGRLSPTLQERMTAAEARTKNNERMTLFVALNYGGRAEIIDAASQAIAEGADPAALGDDDIARHLYAPDMREPDLVIRTSGERRLSNFLLWESAYSELYFSDTLWPDFGEEELTAALRDYASRERRFGAREAADLA